MSESTSASSTRLLVRAMSALLALNLVNGVIAVAAGVNTWPQAWGSEALLAVPLPMLGFQVLLTWLAVRRPGRVAQVAAALLAVACTVCVVSGFFDGGYGNDALTPALVVLQLLLVAGLAAVALAAGNRLRVQLSTTRRAELAPEGSR